jgi:hypothetical protein
MGAENMTYSPTCASPAGSQLGLKRNQIPTNQGGEPT